MTSLSLQALAQNNCSEELNACDLVIKKQDELLLLQKRRLDELATDNEKLSATIVKMTQENESQSKDYRIYGAGGIALGIVLGILVSSK